MRFLLFLKFFVPIHDHYLLTKRLCRNNGNATFVILNPSRPIILSESEGSDSAQGKLREESHQINKLDSRDSSAKAEGNKGQSGFLRPRCSKSDVRMQNDSDPFIMHYKMAIPQNGPNLEVPNSRIAGFSSIRLTMRRELDPTP